MPRRFFRDMMQDDQRLHRLCCLLLGAACVLILADMLSGFQGMRLIWSDIWHHRAVLRVLAENPLHPANPHVASMEGSRSFMPLYVLLGALGHGLHLSPDILLGLAGLANIGLILWGSVLLARAFGSGHWALFLMILLFAWFYPPNYTGFDNLRSLVHTISFPAAHTFGLTLLAWAALLRQIKAPVSAWRPWGWLCLLMILAILSHQMTALLMMVGLGLFPLAVPGNPVPVWLKLGACFIVALLVCLAWPYFDLARVMLSGAEGGWQGPAWFYDPLQVVRIALPTLGGALWLWVAGPRDRIMQVCAALALALFLVYLGAHFLGLSAGHRLLPFWLMFLQIGLFLSLVAAPRDTVAKRLVLGFVLLMAPVQIAFSGLDIAKRPGLDFGLSRFITEKPHDFRADARAARAMLPMGAVVVAYGNAAFPVQAFGVPVVSIPRNAPMVRDMPARQQASDGFFAPGLTCTHRLALVRPYGATHALYMQGDLPEAAEAEITALGPVIRFASGLVLLALPPGCP